MKIKTAEEYCKRYTETDHVTALLTEHYNNGVKAALEAILESGEVEFYANEKSWCNYIGVTYRTIISVDCDDVAGAHGGKRARQLKEKINQALKSLDRRKNAKN